MLFLVTANENNSKQRHSSNIFLEFHGLRMYVYSLKCKRHGLFYTGYIPA